MNGVALRPQTLGWSPRRASLRRTPANRTLSFVQVCADRGVAPGSTKGAAQHLRGIAAGLTRGGHRLVTYTARRSEGPFPTEVRKLSRLADEAAAGADVVYERYSLGHRGGLDLARAIGAHFVLEVNAPLVDEALAHRPGTVESHHRRVEADLLREADLVITVSSALTRWAMRHRSGPTITVTNGFEPEWFPTVDRRHTEPSLVFLGHPKPWHGARQLPRILVDLALRGRRPPMLVIGGGAGADELMDEARRLGVSEQITVTGPLPPVVASELLSTATIGIAPYLRQDPFYFCPLKVVDYLAAGLPVVSTDQGDIASLVGDAGLVVDPDDPDALVEAITTLLDDPDRCAELGRAGRDRAMATLTWDDAAARTATAILSLDRPPSAR